jgi:hypothetical protein
MGLGISVRLLAEYLHIEFTSIGDGLRDEGDDISVLPGLNIPPLRQEE